MKNTTKMILCVMSVCMMFGGIAFATETTSDEAVATDAPAIDLSDIQLVASAGAAGGAGGAGGVASGNGGGATGGGADVQVAQY